MVTAILTTDYSVRRAQALLDDILVERYYFFVGNSVPTNLAPALPNDDYGETVRDSVSGMILGKILGSNSATLLIADAPWTADAPYRMYDDRDPFGRANCYVTVDEGSYRHCYKCLYNNLDANSTVQPTFADLDESDELYQTSDGYRWKYMFSVANSIVAEFASLNMTPLTPNAAVSMLAVDGAIDVISVQDSGIGYANYLDGAFAAGDLRVTGNTLLYQLTGASSGVAGFYTGCVFYVASGTGAGQFEIIEDYFSNSNGNFIVLQDEFAIAPTASATWQVRPLVRVIGTNQTVNAVGRVVINPATNTISSVEMLSRGAGYTFATAQVIANAAVGVSHPAIVEVILPPPGGHGYDAASELGARTVGLQISLANTEGNTIPDTNQYQRVGIIANPLFANVSLTLSNTSMSLFQVDEGLRAISTRFLCDGATASANTTLSTGTNFDTRLVADDWVYLVPDSGGVSTLAQIASVTNSTIATLASNAGFSCTAVQVWLASITANAVVASVVNNSIVYVSQAEPIEEDSLVVGTLTGAYGVVDSVTRSNVAKDYTTFVAATTISLSGVTGTFTQNELIYQGANLATATATAYVFSANSSVMLATGLDGALVETLTITGVASGAVATVSYWTSSEIEPTSGDVIYVESLDAVARGNVESFVIALGF